MVAQVGWCLDKCEERGEIESQGPVINGSREQEEEVKGNPQVPVLEKQRALLQGKRIEPQNKTILEQYTPFGE